MLSPVLVQLSTSPLYTRTAKTAFSPPANRFQADHGGHHPDIHLAWGKVKLTIWTHKIDGLTESDFIFAAKVSEQL